tara:strand:+ start:18 stop:665 length:648 start_codon:yes stop_codon:yes gene_type:complete
MPSDLQVDNIKDGSATKTLATLSSSAVTLHSDVTVPASIGGNEILLDTYSANNTVTFKVFEFTGSYNIYRLRINYLRCSLDNSELKVELGTDSTTFSSSGGDYRFTGHYGHYNGSSFTGGTGHVVNASFVHYDGVGSGDSEGCCLDLLILGPTDATVSTSGYGTGYVYKHDNYLQAFSIATTAKYNARDDSHFKVFFNQGNLGKGKILLYGVKDA